MEGSATASLEEGSEESWEVADVDANMRRLMLSSFAKDSSNTASSVNNNKNQAKISDSLGTDVNSGSGFGMTDDLVNTVDQFLREAIQNPRERLSVLRMEQDVEKFIRDPIREQMEFQQLPTSYLRLAAHRVAQHYSLQSMVLLDNNLPDGSGSRIIVQKTPNLRLPLVRLADIPVNLPTEEGGGAIKVAIKQRPQKGSHSNNNSNAHSSKSNSSKSVEERKEEYNRARARIFSSNSSAGSSSAKPENQPRIQDNFPHGSLGLTKAEEIIFPGGGSDVIISRSLSDSSTAINRLTRSRAEKEPIGRSKTNNRVAIFRDREVDRNDPDYNRSYARYMQRFDPGFGYSGGAYPVQPMYAPAINYNTEFPQLGSSHMHPMSSEHQPRPLPQHLPGTWIAPSAPAVGIGYNPVESMMSPFSSGHVNPHSNPGLYLHSTQYPCQQSGLPYIHTLEPVHQHFPQSHQQHPDTSFGLARPR